MLYTVESSSLSLDVGGAHGCARSCREEIVIFGNGFIVAALLSVLSQGSARGSKFLGSYRPAFVDPG